MKKNITPITSWILALWACRVFLSSLPYKFSNHPDTVHIFSTIGAWLQGFLGDGLGGLFARYGAYGVGSFELITSLTLLSPALFWLLGRISPELNLPSRRLMHRIGGVMASLVMGGAVFFHLTSPLGVEVLHEGKGDGGSLFYAAVSILVSGIILFLINRKPVSAAE
jgi:hypothetical protein